MKFFFELSKENLELARDEVLALAKTENYEMFSNLLVLESDYERFHQRLSMTKRFFHFLFKTALNDFENVLQEFDFGPVNKGAFCVRVHGVSNSENPTISEKKIASLIWNRLEKPKVSIDFPDTNYDFFLVDGYVVAGIRARDIDKGYIKRKNHELPSRHPTSMNPRLARCLINLTGIERGETFLDPFCGSGGLLIEACMMKIRSYGFDIDEIQIRRARENLDHFKLKTCYLELQDGTSFTKEVECVATDLPYGKSSVLKCSLEELFKTFMKNAYARVSKKMTVVVPSTFKFNDLIGEWKLLNFYEWYVHGSLTRKILLFGK